MCIRDRLLIAPILLPVSIFAAPSFPDWSPTVPAGFPKGPLATIKTKQPTNNNSQESTSDKTNQEESVVRGELIVEITKKKKRELARQYIAKRGKRPSKRQLGKYIARKLGLRQAIPIDNINRTFKVKGRRVNYTSCLLYTSPSPRDATLSRMPSSA